MNQSDSASRRFANRTRQVFVSVFGGIDESNFGKFFRTFRFAKSSKLGRGKLHGVRRIAASSTRAFRESSVVSSLSWKLIKKRRLGETPKVLRAKMLSRALEERSSRNPLTFTDANERRKKMFIARRHLNANLRLQQHCQFCSLLSPSPEHFIAHECNLCLAPSTHNTRCIIHRALVSHAVELPPD